MAKPTKGSWRAVKKVARYLIGRRNVVWNYEWQNEVTQCYVASDSDWGGSLRDRKSTSGGAWMLGSHCMKTWSATQGPWALSSGEAELYAMVEAVTRAKGLVSLSHELGFEGLQSVIQLGTDSSAAKSFVYKRGLGRMRHVEIRDLWLQREVREGRLRVEKIPGVENPADLMTKVLSTNDIEDRLKGMNIEFRRSQKERKGGDEVYHPHAYGAAKTLCSVRHQVSPCVCGWFPLCAYQGWAGCPYALGGRLRSQEGKGCEGSINEDGWGKSPPSARPEGKR